MLTLTVIGRPQTRGSKRPFAIPGATRKSGAPLIVTTDDNPRSKPWMDTIRGELLSILPTGWVPIRGPVQLSLVFYFARPKSHFRANGDLNPRAPFWHHQKPDLDKLARPVQDALSGVAYHDDRCIFQYTELAKLWINPGAACQMERVEISVGAVE